VALNVVSMARSAIFYYRLDHTWARYTAWPIIFIAIVWASSLLTWAGWVSILPALGMTLGTLALWSKETKHTRLLILAGRPLWLSYNIAVFSLPGIITETVLICSSLVGMWRLDMPHTQRNGAKNKKL